LTALTVAARRGRQSFIKTRQGKGGRGMTKTELVGSMATKAGISKAEAEEALKAFTGGITVALRKGDQVRLVGFGSFEVSKRAARKGRNPQTGAAIKIKARKSPKFRPGASLKKAVNR
jgi:DNA-binding protein HU-beta